MGISVVDQFNYQGSKFNFERDAFNTLAEMKAFPETSLPPKGFECYCAETDKKYKFNSSNSVDKTTGKWREVTDGSDLQDKTIYLDAYSVDIENISSTFGTPEEFINKVNNGYKVYLTQGTIFKSLCSLYVFLGNEFATPFISLIGSYPKTIGSGTNGSNISYSTKSIVIEFNLQKTEWTKVTQNRDTNLSPISDNPLYDLSGLNDSGTKIMLYSSLLNLYDNNISSIKYADLNSDIPSNINISYNDYSNTITAIISCISPSDKSTYILHKLVVKQDNTYTREIYKVSSGIPGSIYDLTETGAMTDSEELQSIFGMSPKELIKELESKKIYGLVNFTNQIYTDGSNGSYQALPIELIKINTKIVEGNGDDIEPGLYFVLKTDSIADDTFDSSGRPTVKFISFNFDEDTWGRVYQISQYNLSYYKFQSLIEGNSGVIEFNPDKNSVASGKLNIASMILGDISMLTNTSSVDDVNKIFKHLTYNGESITFENFIEHLNGVRNISFQKSNNLEYNNSFNDGIITTSILEVDVIAQKIVFEYICDSKLIKTEITNYPSFSVTRTEVPLNSNGSNNIYILNNISSLKTSTDVNTIKSVLGSYINFKEAYDNNYIYLDVSNYEKCLVNVSVTDNAVEFTYISIDYNDLTNNIMVYRKVTFNSNEWVACTDTDSYFFSDFIEDAPEDYKTYGRKNGEWVNIDNTDTINVSDIPLKSLDGVVDYSLENLFKKEEIETYDSAFANKVYEAIGRKTDSTGCYSNKISCKEGDYFTRNDFGTGIVVVLDAEENILGDIKNAAYQPTIQIKASEEQDFSKASYVVFVVMLTALDTEKIVKAKYVPENVEENSNIIEIPNLRITTANLSKDVAYIKSTSGKYYKIIINDSDVSNVKIEVKLIQDFIPESDLPSDFPFFDFSSSFSDFDYIVLGCSGYIFILSNDGVVKYKTQKTIISNYCIKPLKNKLGQRRFGLVVGTQGGSAYANGYFVLFDEDFNEIDSNVTLTDGSKPESHDFYYIDDNHYILMSYLPSQSYDNGFSTYNIVPLRVEEQKNGKRLWVWDSLDYPDLHQDSHVKNGDYLHCNTITLDFDGNLILNFKQANEAVKIQRTYNYDNDTCTVGGILYKIGGDKGESYGDYDNPNRIKFEGDGIHSWYEPHDIKYCGKTNIEGVDYPTYTIFNNRSGSYSEIIEFSIDYANKQLKSFNAYKIDGYFGRYQGGVQKLSDKRYFVCWGSKSTQPMIGIYDFNKTSVEKVFELSFRKQFDMYRAYGYTDSSYEDGDVIPGVKEKNILTDKESIILTEGTTETLQIKLSEAPNNETIVITIENNDSLIIQPSELTFTKSNYNEYQSVNLSISTEILDTTTSQINLIDATKEFVDKSVQCSIVPYYESDFTLSPSSMQIATGETITDKLCIVLNSKPLKLHTISINAENEYVTVNSNTLTFDSNNWNIPQYISITGKLYEEYENYNCKITAIDNITGNSKYSTITVTNSNVKENVVLLLDASNHGTEPNKWKDLSGNGNDLTLYGFDGSEWEFEKGLRFNGTSTYGKCENFMPFIDISESQKDFNLECIFAFNDFPYKSILILQLMEEISPYYGLNIQKLSIYNLRVVLNLGEEVKNEKTLSADYLLHQLKASISITKNSENSGKLYSCKIEDITNGETILEYNKEYSFTSNAVQPLVIGALEKNSVVDSGFFNGWIKYVKFSWI